MGGDYEPIQGKELTGRLALPQGINVQRLQDRQDLRRQFDRLQRGLERAAEVRATDRYTEMAYDMVSSGRVQEAFDIGAKATPRATPMAAGVSARKRCSRGGWSRRESPSCWSAARGATSTTTATK